MVEKLQVIFLFASMSRSPEAFVERMEREFHNETDKSKLFFSAGLELSKIGKYNLATASLFKSLEYLSANPDQSREAGCYANLGDICNKLSNHEKAIEYNEKAVKLCEGLMDAFSITSICYVNLGIAYKKKGDYTKAISYYQKAVQATETTGDKMTEALAYMDMGNAYRNLREFKSALENHSKALILFREINDRCKEAACLLNMGNVLDSSGNHQEAIKSYEGVLHLATGLSNEKSLLSASYANLAIAYSRLHDYAKTKEFGQKALPLAMELGNIETQIAMKQLLNDCHKI
jgi:tetratricopeptide (TPR) repeat protein